MLETLTHSKYCSHIRTMEISLPVVPKYWLRLFEFGLYVRFFFSFAFLYFLIHTHRMLDSHSTFYQLSSTFLQMPTKQQHKVFFSYTFQTKHQKKRKNRKRKKSLSKWHFFGVFGVIFSSLLYTMNLHGNEKKGISSISFIKQSLCHFLTGRKVFI